MRITKTVKTLIKRALRPLRPVRALMLRPVELRLTAVEASVSAIEARLSAIEAGWRQHLPALLNAVSGVGAVGFELSAVWKRIEFVRKEMLYEFKYSPNSSQPRPARIVSPEKLERARSTGLRVNLGCGHLPLEDYLNVDQRELPGVDIVADAGALPFEASSVQEIFSAHVLEHFPQQYLRKLLPYWCGLLAPKGTFRAVVPDGEAMLAGIANGSYRFEHFREVLFGAQEYDGDFHFNLLTPDSLTELLKEAGFDEIAVPVRGRKNDICFEFEISAKKQA